MQSRHFGFLEPAGYETVVTAVCALSMLLYCKHLQCTPDNVMRQ